MSVKKEPSGRRSVESSVVVPGTPEEVWRAIATAQGISSWFAPTELEEREGGSLVCHIAPGMDAKAKVTSWDPPHRFAAEGSWGPGAPPVATEWIVEAQSGNTCVVRVVHSLFADTDDWDGQLEGTESGWPKFFDVLRLYLTHFRNENGSIVRAMGAHDGTWGTLLESFGLAGAVQGDAVQAEIPGRPTLTGTMEHLEESYLLLRLEQPMPGVASLSTFPMGGKAAVNFGLHLFGPEAADVAAREEPDWQAWMAEHYPFG